MTVEGALSELRDPRTIRARCDRILEVGLRGELEHFSIDLAKLKAAAQFTAEKLDGTGYPNALRGPQIPIQARMMAISDIYDALTASDRPYKKAMPMEKALDIMSSDVKRGQLDSELFNVFVAAMPMPLPAPLRGAPPSPTRGEGKEDSEL